MSSLFDQQVDAVAEGTADVWFGADVLYDAMSEQERLWILSGDLSWASLLYEVFTKGPNFTPSPAGRVDRVGLPGFAFGDGPRGVVVGRSTSFPTSSTRGCTWNPGLEQEVGEAMGLELRAQGGNMSAAVCVNLLRHPKWGRAQESYGEDPIVLGAMGAALTKGLRKNVMAVVKHFVCNSMENLRFRVNVTVDEATLHEVYTPHFKQCIQDGGAESIMSSYNSVNGKLAGDHSMLNTIVRVSGIPFSQEDIWQREDVIIQSDWVYGTKSAVDSINAGLDLEMPVRSTRSEAALQQAIRNGTLTWDTIRRLCIRMIACQLKYHARMSNVPAPAMDVVQCLTHRELARRVATEGMILLKNGLDGSKPLLPLHSQRTMAIIGELAVSRQTGDGGSSLVKEKTRIVTVIEGFAQRSGLRITYKDGRNVPQAIKAAEAADIVLFVSGYTAKEEGERISDTELNKEEAKNNPTGIMRVPLIGSAWSGCLRLLSSVAGPAAGGDRESLRLTPQHENIATELSKAVGHKLILAIEASATVILPRVVRTNTAAILWTGYGGCEFGNALRQVFWNENGVEPGGRLTFCIPEREDDHVDLDFTSTEVVYDRWWGYRLLRKEGKKAAFPFGFGLSYGKTDISPQLCLPQRIDSAHFQVGVEISNPGERPTTTVVQVYAGNANKTDPDDHTRVLIGFEKLSAPARSIVNVLVNCKLEPLARFEVSRNTFYVSEGSYTFWAGQYDGDDRSAEASLHLETIEWS